MSAFDDIREIVPLQIWDGVIGRAVAGEEATLARSSSSRMRTCPSTTT